MKQLTCEMCGSTDLLKQDGVFVCQTCGTKYSLEEAKKMMIEGTVDVSGSTVKVDNSASINNFYTMAVSAYEAENKAEAENYCNKIIEIEPENYETWFLKGKAAGWQSTLAKLRIEESVQCFSKAVDYAPDDKKDDIKKQAAEEVSDLSVALISLCCNNYISLPSDSNASSIVNNVIKTQDYVTKLLVKCGVKADDFNSKIAIMMNNAATSAWRNTIVPNYKSSGHPSKHDLTRLIEQSDGAIRVIETAIIIEKDKKENNKTRYENLIAINTLLIDAWSYTYSNGGYIKETSLSDEAKRLRIDSIMKWHEKIKEIDPTHVVPSRPVPKSGGCYVATCVYGSYDCPEVWTLRRYRDYTLAETWYGRAFIHTYYAISPTIVKLFGNTKWFKKMWKGKLDRMIADLQSKGVENTPYNDREW